MSQEASDLTEGANRSIAWSSIDAFSKVMGKEKHGRVRGLGFRPTPSNWSGSKNSFYRGVRITSEEERLKDDKICRLTDKVSTLEDKLAMVMQHIQLPANTDLQVINMWYILYALHVLLGLLNYVILYLYIIVLLHNLG